MRVLHHSILLLPLVLHGSATLADDVDPPSDPATPVAPQNVEVEPTAEDPAIEERLLRILEATEWFGNPRVAVDEGVVFLAGTTKKDHYRDWAEELAGNTRDVVAVVNRIEVTRPALLDFGPAYDTIEELVRAFVQSLPMIVLAFIVLLLTFLAAGLARRIMRWVLRSRLDQSLLRSVAVNVIGCMVFLIGVYLVLKVSGLTRLAATIIGGTGLFGLVVGIAFRDIAENFLASILITLQRPFQAGDLVEVDGKQGFVEAVTTRGTLLMDFEGNHIQIPNATIYKSVIKNYTANPNVRIDFVVGIGYVESVTAAQETALAVLREHSAVLADPEPMVLVEQLGPSTVDLRVYFWVNASEHSKLKVKSAVVRLVKARFEQEGLTMPDQSREVIFPDGVPVRMLETSDPEAERPAAAAETTSDPRDAESVGAEGELLPEEAEIREQARQSRRPEEGVDMLQ